MASANLPSRTNVAAGFDNCAIARAAHTSMPAKSREGSAPLIEPTLSRQRGGPPVPGKLMGHPVDNVGTYDIYSVAIGSFRENPFWLLVEALR